MENDIITIKEVADCLRIKEKTTYGLVSKGEIPGFKVGGSWRFKRDEIRDWIEKQGNKDIKK